MNFDPETCKTSQPKIQGESSRSPVRPLLSKAKPNCVLLIKKPTWSKFQKSSQTDAARITELRILDFKTTCSEFQKPSQTAATRGEAELRILDFKTTWSEFQKPSQTATEQGEAELRLLNFKNTWRGNGMLLGATSVEFLEL